MERLKSCSRVKTTWQSAWMLSGIVSSEAGKMKGQVNAITNKYNMNRAQRRQEGKKNKHGKNGAVVTPIGNASGRDNS